MILGLGLTPFGYLSLTVHFMKERKLLALSSARIAIYKEIVT